jgi:hypothetical protein
LSGQKSGGVLAALLALLRGVHRDGLGAHAATFNSASIVMYRVGDGSQTLTNTNAAAIALDEYNVTGTSASRIQTVSLPTSGSTAVCVNGATSSGNAPPGSLGINGDGCTLVFAGFNVAIGSAISSTTLRAVAFVYSDTAQDLATTFTLANGGMLGGAVGNGTDLWASDSNQVRRGCGRWCCWRCVSPRDGRTSGRRRLASRPPGHTLREGAAPLTHPQQRECVCRRTTSTAARARPPTAF